MLAGALTVRLPNVRLDAPLVLPVTVSEPPMRASGEAPFSTPVALAVRLKANVPAATEVPPL